MSAMRKGQRRYAPEFRAEVAAFCAERGAYQAASTFGCSVFAARRWMLRAGYPPRRPGAPIPREIAGQKISTAMLAFSETWLRV